MEAQLKGWPAAIAVVLAIGAVVGYRIYFHGNPEISAELREKLELNLMSELAGEMAGDVESIDAALQRGDTVAAERVSRDLLSRKVKLDDFAMRGGMDDIIVRAEYSMLGPGEPQSRVGYYRYSYSKLTGWRYHYETTAWNWRMKLF